MDVVGLGGRFASTERLPWGEGGTAGVAFPSPFFGSSEMPGHITSAHGVKINEINEIH
jgi:hypothetical protein